MDWARPHRPPFGVFLKEKKQFIFFDASPYIDIQKAYDSVNREKLWQILKQFGFSDIFIGCIQNLYTNDYVTSSVNGMNTRPTFLTRGVRQGCSLSPIYLHCI